MSDEPRPSAASGFDFRVERLQFDSRVVDAKLPIDAALLVVDVPMPGGRRDRTLARFCGRILDGYPAVWLFVAEDGVEPTNNHAERVQRRAVLWRGRSFGCHSADGCRFVERILTVVQTLRQQGRSVVGFLRETIAGCGFAPLRR